MKYKPYPPEKIAFILNKSEDELWYFFQEINKTEKNQLIKILPKVSGFRPDSQEGIHQRFNKFINKAKNSEQWSQTIRFIWESWIRSQLNLNDSLNNYTNDEDFSDEVVSPNSRLDIGCFVHLARLSHQLDRSLIKRFYEFGYFQIDPLIEQIIDNSFNDNVQTISVQGEHEQDLINDITKYPQVLHRLQVRVAKLETELIPSKQQTDLEPDLEPIKQALDEFSAWKTAIEENYNNLQIEINQRLNYQSLDELRNEINEKINNQTTHLSNVKDHIFDLEKSIIDRIDKLEKIQSEQEDSFLELLEESKETNYSTPTYITPTGLYTSQLEPLDNDIITNIDLKSDLTERLINNFKASGLIKGEARKLAYEVLAGLSAGEWMIFSGSLADILVEVCTKTIAAQYPANVIHIPTGLLDGRQFSSELKKIVKKNHNSKHVCAVVIEGINRSAVECYAQSLRRIIIHRLLGMPESVPHIAFFGTLVTGAIALPISSELCELGPIFNTDVLGWKSDFQVENCTYGTVTPSLLMGNRETHPLQLCDKFELSQLWKICLQKAGNYLNEENRLSSLIFAWLMPGLMGVEENMTTIKECLEEYSIDDGRIKKMLNVNKCHAYS